MIQAVFFGTTGAAQTAPLTCTNTAVSTSIFLYSSKYCSCKNAIWCYSYNVTPCFHSLVVRHSLSHNITAVAIQARNENILT